MAVSTIINDGAFMRSVSIFEASFFKVVAPASIRLSPPNLISIKPKLPLRRWTMASHSSPLVPRGGLAAIFWTFYKYGSHSLKFLCQETVNHSISILLHNVFFFSAAKSRIIFDIQHIKRYKKCYIRPFGGFSLCHLAIFYYGIWLIFIMTFG